MRLALYKRGKVYWVRGTLHGEKWRRTTGHSEKGAADLVRRRWEREFADPTHHASNEATVETAASRFLNELQTTAKSKSTWNFYEHKVRHVVRLLGRARLKDLSHDRVLAYIRERETEGAHSHSIHRELTAIRRTLKSASRAGEFSRDPRLVIPEYAAGYEPRTRWLTEAELPLLLAQLSPARAAMVAFCVATSARRKEAREARAEDITPTSVFLRGTKTKRSRREVPRMAIFATTFRWVTDFVGDRTEGQLFAPWGNMRRDIIAAAKRAGIPPLSTNDLRRTTATWLVRANVPFELIAKVMGHASTAMLYKVYGQVDASSLRASIDEITGR